MKLYLIRHAETVDNVAGKYAGVRDSKLTVHGIEQADRLGQHLAQSQTRLTHIFSSPLTRTVKTAEAVQKAQLQVAGRESNNGSADASAPVDLEIVKVPDLIEQDFGYYEGKPFRARSDAKRMGRESDADRRRNEPGFVDVESRESMCRRADAFLEQHLLPLFEAKATASQLNVAVVSHGMLLSHLWRRLLLRVPRKSLTIVPEVTSARGSVVLEHLGGWSNTGYLELLLESGVPSAVSHHRVSSKADGPLETDQTTAAPRVGTLVASQGDDVATSSPTKTAPKLESTVRDLTGWKTTILAIDSRQHLVGLKRQRGGIGRQAYDEGQKKLDGFFTKRQKLQE